MNTLEVMNWAELIEQIKKDFRKSLYQLSNMTGISSGTLSNIATGKTKQPQSEVINKLEESLNIKIDDTTLDNITYTKLSEKKEFEFYIENNQYPILSEISAGVGEMIKEHLGEYGNFPYKKKENVFALRVSGDSMNGVASNGDLVLIDMDAEIINGKIVAVLLKDGRKLIKKYRELEEGYIQLYSSNTNYEPIIIKASDIEVIYRVVQIVHNV